ncbi:hypothetical protein [Ornithinimicrobium sediminis]|uniref:hypothetical protein n=1 Tax=Ornithinimicrobium sediminis TaxID=2904603 RepID=UPI001E2B8D67|nr:hypothetical protein [Ornithinimicrobium sediminis]MCE0488127.1 hypothetical protein [Ornithinimicrobium sediminis]
MLLVLAREEVERQIRRVLYRNGVPVLFSRTGIEIPIEGVDDVTADLYLSVSSVSVLLHEPDELTLTARFRGSAVHLNLPGGVTRRFCDLAGTIEVRSPIFLEGADREVAFGLSGGLDGSAMDVSIDLNDDAVHEIDATLRLLCALLPDCEPSDPLTWKDDVRERVEAAVPAALVDADGVAFRGGLDVLEPDARSPIVPKELCGFRVNLPFFNTGELILAFRLADPTCPGQGLPVSGFTGGNERAALAVANDFLFGEVVGPAVAVGLLGAVERPDVGASPWFRTGVDENGDSDLPCDLAQAGALVLELQAADRALQARNAPPPPNAMTPAEFIVAHALRARTLDLVRGHTGAFLVDELCRTLAEDLNRLLIRCDWLSDARFPGRSRASEVSAVCASMDADQVFPRTGDPYFWWDLVLENRRLLDLAFPAALAATLAVPSEDRRATVDSFFGWSDETNGRYRLKRPLVIADDLPGVVTGEITLTSFELFENDGEIRFAGAFKGKAFGNAVIRFDGTFAGGAELSASGGQLSTDIDVSDPQVDTQLGWLAFLVATLLVGLLGAMITGAVTQAVLNTLRPLLGRTIARRLTREDLPERSEGLLLHRVTLDDLVLVGELEQPRDPEFDGTRIGRRAWELDLDLNPDSSPWSGPPHVPDVVLRAGVALEARDGAELIDFGSIPAWRALNLGHVDVVHPTTAQRRLPSLAVDDIPMDRYDYGSVVFPARTDENLTNPVYRLFPMRVLGVRTAAGRRAMLWLWRWPSGHVNCLFEVYRRREDGRAEIAGRVTRHCRELDSGTDDIMLPTPVLTPSGLGWGMDVEMRPAAAEWRQCVYTHDGMLEARGIALPAPLTGSWRVLKDGALEDGSCSSRDNKECVALVRGETTEIDLALVGPDASRAGTGTVTFTVAEDGMSVQSESSEGADGRFTLMLTIRDGGCMEHEAERAVNLIGEDREEPGREGLIEDLMEFERLIGGGPQDFPPARPGAGPDPEPGMEEVLREQLLPTAMPPRRFLAQLEALVADLIAEPSRVTPEEIEKGLRPLMLEGSSVLELTLGQVERLAAGDAVDVELSAESVQAAIAGRVRLRYDSKVLAGEQVGSSALGRALDDAFAVLTRGRKRPPSGPAQDMSGE